MQVRTTREYNAKTCEEVPVVLALTALNVISTLLECGFTARPDNPVAHELLNARRKAGAYSYSMILGHDSALIFHLKSLRTRSKTDTPSR
jgi:hypothetical protein